MWDKDNPSLPRTPLLTVYMLSHPECRPRLYLSCSGFCINAVAVGESVPRRRGCDDGEVAGTLTIPAGCRLDTDRLSTLGSIPPPPSVPPHSSGPTGWPTTKAPSLIDDAHDACKGWGEKRGFSKNGNGSGGRTVCPRGLSFSEFIVLMSTINCEKDTPLGQTVLPPEPFPFF